MNKLLVGTLTLSCLTNVALLSDVSRLEKKTDKVINTLNRANLIATLYVLKEKQNLFNKNFKEDNHMKNFGGKFSNRTKAIGGVTILLGIGTVISAVKDKKELREIDEVGEEMLDLIPEEVGGIIDDIEDATSEIVE